MATAGLLNLVDDPLSNGPAPSGSGRGSCPTRIIAVWRQPSKVRAAGDGRVSNCRAGPAYCRYATKLFGRASKDWPFRINCVAIGCTTIGSGAAARMWPIYRVMSRGRND
jgi:hypothetical protein